MTKEGKSPFADYVRQTQPAASLRLHKPDPAASEEAGEAQQGADDPRRYEAVRVASREPRLDFIPATGPGHAPPYIGLVDVLFDAYYPGICIVVFNSVIIVLTGQNLTPVAAAIKKHKAEAITCYNAKHFDVPEEGAPVIERMEFRMGQTIESMVEIISQTAG